MNGCIKKNYIYYQECGEQKYLRASERYEDMADAFLMAANAKDDHQALVRLRGYVSEFASKADSAIHNNAEAEEMKQILKDLIAIAQIVTGYSSPWR